MRTEEYADATARRKKALAGGVLGDLTARPSLGGGSRYAQDAAEGGGDFNARLRGMIPAVQQAAGGAPQLRQGGGLAAGAAQKFQGVRPIGAPNPDAYTGFSQPNPMNQLGGGGEGALGNLAGLTQERVMGDQDEKQRMLQAALRYLTLSNQRG